MAGSPALLIREIEHVEDFILREKITHFDHERILEPGIDFSNDPLLQGRLFSYIDTQLSRLGSPDFHQIPINAPKCPFGNHQRDGHMQMEHPTGRVAYEPNSLSANSPRQRPVNGTGKSLCGDYHNHH